MQDTEDASDRSGNRRLVWAFSPVGPACPLRCFVFVFLWFSVLGFPINLRNPELRIREFECFHLSLFQCVDLTCNCKQPAEATVQGP